MRSRLAATGVLLEIAFRNLFQSRVKTLIVGGIILMGALIVVLGSSVLDSVDGGMRRSIQGSLGGHIQLFNKHSREDLALYGGMMGDSDILPLEDFAALKAVVARVPNVKTVVPMGIHDAIIGSSTELDLELAALREAAGAVRDGPTPERLARYQALQAHVRHMIRLQHELLQKTGEITDQRFVDERERADMAEAASDTFWRDFDRDPFDALEFLENRIAPQSVDGSILYIRYAGTDLELFPTAFAGMKIVAGTAVPKGRRGILLARYYAEEMLKLKPARRLDKIKLALEHGRKIAGDRELESWVKDNLAQTRDILMQLDPGEEKVAVARLQKALGSTKTSTQELLAELLAVDDASFFAHYRIFYDELAPLLRLYAVNIGDTLTIKAFTQAGYMKAVNVRVYGLYEFAGLEQSAFAGFICLMDLMSFRDLYGYLTQEKTREIAALKETAGARDVARADAEATLFGGGGDLVGDTRATAIDEAALLAPGAAGPRQEDLAARVYTQDEIDSGVVLNAAVILHDPARIAETMRAIEAATGQAGLPVKAITWQQASGMIGQFVNFARFVLYLAIFIIFVVALVIINNAMLLATLQRVREIGTIRAIGAQRRFVLLMLLVESSAVGLAFGAAGALIGAGVVGVIRAAGGIPAASEELYFFFSGPALSPVLGATSLGVALVIVLAVSILSGIYPAIVATRITPVQAMQTED